MSNSSHFNDPRHWRQRAEEARALAEDMKGAEAKRMMLKTAEDYDKLAVMAAVRLGIARGASANCR